MTRPNIEVLQQAAEGPADGDVTVTTVQGTGPHRDTVQVQLDGWLVNIAGPYVTVPRQDSTGKTSASLARCLAIAHNLAGITTLGPADTVVRSPRLGAALIDTMNGAQEIARKYWSPRSRDVYGSVRDAWQAHGMVVPYTLLIAAVRAALPPDTTLIDYNDRADQTQIDELFSRAVELFDAAARQWGVA